MGVQSVNFIEKIHVSITTTHLVVRLRVTYDVEETQMFAARLKSPTIAHSRMCK